MLHNYLLKRSPFIRICIPRFPPYGRLVRKTLFWKTFRKRSFYKLEYIDCSHNPIFYIFLVYWVILFLINIFPRLPSLSSKVSFILGLPVIYILYNKVEWSLISLLLILLFSCKVFNLWNLHESSPFLHSLLVSF